MNNPDFSFKCRALSVAVLLAVMATPAARADDGEDIETLRSTTQELIETLVEAGVLTRDKADNLVRVAQARARAKKAAAPAPAVAENGKKTVRVFHVPESVKNDLRDEIRRDVMAQAKSEGWAQPGVVPDWLERFSFEGDMRLRYQSDRLPGSNTPAGYAFIDSASYATRAVDMLNLSSNAQDNRDRFRLQARLGVQAKLSDTLDAGLRITTGNTSDRVSTNQTLGQNFNKYSLVLDRAYLRYRPLESLTLSGGRIPNPFLSTDLVWDPDLNFEGFAATWRQGFGRVEPFLTLGYFPLREDNPPSAGNRSLFAVQGGTALKLAEASKLTLGLAWYKFDKLEGRLENDDAYNYGVDPVQGYATRYGYPAGLRQKGNTLLPTNALSDDCASTSLSNCTWGLASKFSELNLTASLDLALADPLHLVLTGDYVKNLGFDRAEIGRRMGVAPRDGKDFGYQLRAQLGYPKIARRHDWNAYMTYRYLGSDAVVDAFTDSDFGLGGTNSKGYVIGGNYGLDSNFWLGARWMSADQIEAYAPTTSATINSTKYSVDTLMVDFNAKF